MIFKLDTITVRNVTVAMYFVISEKEHKLFLHFDGNGEDPVWIDGQNIMTLTGTDDHV